MKIEIDAYSNTKEITAHLAEGYSHRLRTHGVSPTAVRWNDSEQQRARFSNLCFDSLLRTASILDVGCGLGHLIDFLDDIGWKGEYLGLDASVDLVDAASLRRPDHQFIASDFLVYNPTRKHETIFFCGVFNDWRPDSESFLMLMLNHASMIAEKLIVFNCIERKKNPLSHMSYYDQSLINSQIRSLGFSYKMQRHQETGNLSYIILL